jgi:hypothetical protein
MSIQNMLTAPLFKSDSAGRTLMYPNGALGRGYVVPDAPTEQKMRRTLMWLIISSGLFGGIGMQAMLVFYGQIYMWSAEPWMICVAAFVVFGVAYRMMANSLARGMMPTEQRMGMVEALKRQSEAMPRWYLWSIAVVAPLMVAGYVIWMVLDASMANYALGLAGIVIFAALMIQAVHGLTTHRPQN